MYLLTWLLMLVLLVWAFERYYLRGRRIKDYPPPVDPEATTVFDRPDPGPEHLQAVKAVRELTLNISAGMGKHEIRVSREAFDAISDGHTYKSTFTPTDAGGVPAEWVMAPGADKDRRVLYIHGGGFVVGSPKSHRTMTSQFSEVTGFSVLAIDYRLMPEARLMDCVADCRTAYHWILTNGPDGPEDLRQLFISGDSAGGNLSLSLAAWIRDNDLRAADAVVAFSPFTDATFSGASIHENVNTDFMLKPFMRILNKIPPFIKSWWALWTYKIRPGSPLVSPLLGNLSDLPPTLVQASEAEMLRDDARRYVYKACAAGSPVKLQTWTDMLHIWQIFYPQLPQAREAWSEVEKFLKDK